MMDTVSAIANTNGRIRVPARINGDCPRHPGVSRLECEPCIEAAKLRAQEAEVAEVVTSATEACDRAFPRRYRSAAASHPEVLDWIASYHASPAECPGLLILGPVGTGKTWQAYGALRTIATTPRRSRSGDWLTPTWRAATHAEIAASMRPRRSVDVDAEHVMSGYCRSALVVIDDLAMTKDSEWVEEITYRLIGSRYNDQKPTIFTTNIKAADIKTVLGDRIASRIAESCRVVPINGIDLRRAN
jgi:DNA replication protein DnaC